LQARVAVYNDTGSRIGALRNKVRALGLAKQDWVALLDSDNFASPEHYWRPLIAFWNSTFGSAPPEDGNRAAEIRSVHPGAYWKTKELLKPADVFGRDLSVVAALCTRNGDLNPNRVPDPLRSIGSGCWEKAFDNILVSGAW
jgi:hypothetical protein